MEPEIPGGAVWPWGWGCVCNSLWGVEGRNQNQNANTRPGARDELEAGSRRGLGCHPQLRGWGLRGGGEHSAQMCHCDATFLPLVLPPPPQGGPQGWGQGPPTVPLPQRKKRPFSPETSQRADTVLSASYSAWAPAASSPGATTLGSRHGQRTSGQGQTPTLRAGRPCGPSQSPSTSLSLHLPPLMMPVSPGHWEVGMTPCT